MTTLALYAVVVSGVIATYASTRRLVDAAAARSSAAVLTTLPLYVVHGLLLRDDAITFGGEALAFAGLGVALLAEVPVRERLRFLAVGAAGMALAGEARGLLLGAALPLLSVGRAAALVPSPERSGRALAALTLAAGAAAAALGLLALVERAPPVHPAPTFDAALSGAVHGLFPWSAVLPLVGSALARSASSAPRPGRALRVALALSLGLGYGMVALCTRMGLPVPFVAPAVVAMSVGLTIRDLDLLGGRRGLRASPSAILAALSFAALLVCDAVISPGTALAPFAGLPLTGAAEATLASLVPISTATLALGIVLLCVPRLALSRLVGPGTWLLGWGVASALLLLLGHHAR